MIKNKILENYELIESYSFFRITFFTNLPLRKHDYSKNSQNVVENELYNVEISFKQITTNKKIVTIFENLETIWYKVHVSGKFTTIVMKKGLILNDSPE